MGKVIATCISEIKGIQKKNVHQVKLIEDFGIEGDAHAGKWLSLIHILINRALCSSNTMATG